MGADLAGLCGRAGSETRVRTCAASDRKMAPAPPWLLDHRADHARGARADVADARRSAGGLARAGAVDGIATQRGADAGGIRALRARAARPGGGGRPTEARPVQEGLEQPDDLAGSDVARRQE